MLTAVNGLGIGCTGACGGETACSTCHVIMSPEVFKKLPEMSEAEEDMLDLAAGLTDTSRLGCQVRAWVCPLNGSCAWSCGGSVVPTLRR